MFFFSFCLSSFFIFTFFYFLFYWSFLRSLNNELIKFTYGTSMFIICRYDVCFYTCFSSFTISILFNGYNIRQLFQLSKCINVLSFFVCIDILYCTSKVVFYLKQVQPTAAVSFHLMVGMMVPRIILPIVRGKGDNVNFFSQSYFPI